MSEMWDGESGKRISPLKAEIEPMARIESVSFSAGHIQAMHREDDSRQLLRRANPTMTTYRRRAAVDSAAII